MSPTRALTTCQNQQTDGCDLLGGRVLAHKCPRLFTLTGNVVESVCVVAVIPACANPAAAARPPCRFRRCAAASAARRTIPAYAVRQLGPSGKGFALVKTLTQGYATGRLPVQRDTDFQ